MTILDLTPKLAKWSTVVYAELLAPAYKKFPEAKLIFMVTRYRKLGRWRYLLDCIEDELEPEDVELVFHTMEAAELEVPKIEEYLNRPKSLAPGVKIIKIWAGTIRWLEEESLPMTPEQEEAFTKYYNELIED